MEKQCKVCLFPKDADKDFFKKVNVCKSCKNIQQNLRNRKLPLPESMMVKKVEFNFVCSVCDTKQPNDYFHKKSNVCKECIAKRQKFYAKKVPLPDYLKSKNTHKVLNFNHVYTERVSQELEPLKICNHTKIYENNGLSLLLEYSINGNLLHTRSL